MTPTERISTQIGTLHIIRGDEIELEANCLPPAVGVLPELACDLGPSVSWVRLSLAFLSRKPPHQPVQLQSGVVNGVSSVAADALVVVADPLR